MASNIITLNVGGTIYTTSIETLTRYPDSMLGTMFGTQPGNSGSQLDPSNRDEHGRFVIDRDGPMFRYVLNFLRESSLTLPEDFKELELLRREAEFYQIEPLIETIKRNVVKCIHVEYYGQPWSLFGDKEILDDVIQQLGLNLDFDVEKITGDSSGVFQGYRPRGDAYDAFREMSVVITVLTEAGFRLVLRIPEKNLEGTWIFQR